MGDPSSMPVPYPSSMPVPNPSSMPVSAPTSSSLNPAPTSSCADDPNWRAAFNGVTLESYDCVPISANPNLCDYLFDINNVGASEACASACGSCDTDDTDDTDVTCINDPDFEWDPYGTQNYYLTCDYLETYPALCEAAVSDDGISAVVACPE